MGEIMLRDCPHAGTPPNPHSSSVAPSCYIVLHAFQLYRTPLPLP